MEFVDFECVGAKYFCQFAARGTSQKVHLPEPVGSGGISLREVKILVVCGLDVRNPPSITPDRDPVDERWKLNTSGIDFCVESQGTSAEGAEYYSQGQVRAKRARRPW